ncbi:sperm surface protein Sp17 [Bombyx mori]|uniref:Sperm surface protein Sp17 n=1 Tax=Bombyx mori TaxID=7091 RepID=A0A8R2R5U5_BOMMO|nr:sperm surface protein Sp17 [Bombyx mori]
MGCNTSSEAKNEKNNQNEQKAQNNENKANNATEEKNKEGVKSEEQAATKIQAAFRGHRTRKSMSMKAAKQEPCKPEPVPTKAELEAEFKSDDKELCHAATKIQASFRGHQARKETQAQKEKEKQDKEDIEKIDLTDPDLNKAATKIQASFRGHKVRKDVPN